VKSMIPCESVGIVTTAGIEVTTLCLQLGGNFRKFENMCECLKLGDAMIDSIGLKLAEVNARQLGDAQAEVEPLLHMSISVTIIMFSSETTLSHIWSHNYSVSNA